MVAISASERQQAVQIENFTEFQKRLSDLDLGHLNILPAMFYWDITFFDHSLLPDDAMIKLEKDIHDTLFPNVEFSWAAYCEARGLSSDDQIFKSGWRNAKCDVQALWAHIHHRRDVFVTSDKRFHSVAKKNALLSLGSGEIVYPDTVAAQLIGPHSDGS